MTREMNFPGHPRPGIAQGTVCARDDRHSLLIDILMGGIAAPETWIETMLDRIEARP